MFEVASEKFQFFRQFEIISIFEIGFGSNAENGLE